MQDSSMERKIGMTRSRTQDSEVTPQHKIQFAVEEGSETTRLFVVKDSTVIPRLNEAVQSPDGEWYKVSGVAYAYSENVKIVVLLKKVEQ